MEKLLLTLIAGSAIGIVVLLIVYVLVTKKSNKIKKLSKQTKNRGKNHSRHLQKLYIVLNKRVYGGKLLHFFREPYELSSLYSEEQIRFRSIVVLLTIVVLTCLGLVIAAITGLKLSHIVILIVSVYLGSQSLTSIHILGMRKKILLDQIQLNKKIRLKYYETRIVDDAVELAADELMDEGLKEAARQGYRIVHVLQAKDRDEQILMYNEAAPNRYFKLLLGLCYMTQEYGDAIEDQVSSYTYSLKLLNQEIRLEYDKKNKTGYILNAVDILIVLPLLFTGFIVAWLSDTFYDLTLYFSSSLGILTSVAMYLIVIVCYLVLKAAREDTDDKVIRKRKPKQINPYLKHVIIGIKPMRYTRQMANLEKRLREARTGRDVDQFYLKKLVYGLLGLIVAISLIIVMHQASISNIIELPSVSYMDFGANIGALSDEDMTVASQVTDFDNEVMSGGRSESEIRQFLEDRNLSQAEIEVITDRILDKVRRMGKERLRWYEFLIAVAFAILCYFIPEMILEVRQRIYKVEEEDEVSLFNSLILMLINNHGMDVYEILRWLTLFGRIYKEDLEVTMTWYDCGATQALRVLKGKTENSSMKELTDSLLRANSNLSLKEAFDELVSDKVYFYDKRREENERLIAKKIQTANIISLAPLVCFVVLYLVAPIMYLAVAGFNNLNLEQLM